MRGRLTFEIVRASQVYSLNGKKQKKVHTFVTWQTYFSKLRNDLRGSCACTLLIGVFPSHLTFADVVRFLKGRSDTILRHRFIFRIYFIATFMFLHGHTNQEGPKVSDGKRFTVTATNKRDRIWYLPPRNLLLTAGRGLMADTSFPTCEWVWQSVKFTWLIDY